MSDNPLPSLFGRFTAIFRDHDRFAETLRSLRATCAALEQGDTSSPRERTPAKLLHDLAGDLAQHFEAEESPAYFGTLVAEAPELRWQVAGLEVEHRTMLAAAQILADVAREPSRWLALPQATRALLNELEQHERAESKLLRQLFDR
jgi:hypothetical protein